MSLVQAGPSAMARRVALAFGAKATRENVVGAKARETPMRAVRVTRVWMMAAVVMMVVLVSVCLKKNLCDEADNF